jgi:hypothetical protein
MGDVMNRNKSNKVNDIIPFLFSDDDRWTSGNVSNHGGG